MSAPTPEQWDQMGELAALQAEPLHPDLVPYETTNGLGMRMIAHPLVHDILPINGMANRTYLRKTQELERAIEACDWRTVVFLHERPYRCEALIDYVLGRDEETGLPFSVKDLDLSDEERDVVAQVWTDSENIHQHIDDWAAIFSGHEPGMPLLLGDQAAFDALPTGMGDTIEVWRGDCDDGGWSWTTERSVAEFFCKRWDQGNDLLHGWARKRDVFGYLTSRSESEVMVRLSHVSLVSRTPWADVVSGNEQ